MADPLISVVMAAYNAEAYITEAMESILNQSFGNFEFIIINDGSADGTLARINGFSDKRIVLINSEKNCGLAASLNKGIKAAKGKYIARMDADDISGPLRFEKQLFVLEKNPEYDVCVTPMKLFGTEASTNGEGDITDKDIKAELIWGTPTNHATMLMKTEKIREHNLYYDETFGVGQDWKFWYDVRDHVKIYNLNELLYFYRRGQHNVTVQSKDKVKQRAIRMYELLFRDLGIQFTDQDLYLHQFINGFFYDRPNAETVILARKWYRKLIDQNKLVAKYELDSFEATVAKKWDRLFYLIAPYGIKTASAYFISSGVRWNHVSYFLKFNLKHLLKGKKFRNQKSPST